MTPSPRGWKVFPMPRAFTHSRITWAFSPSASQVPGVTPRSPLCPWCFEHSLRGGAWQHLPRTHYQVHFIYYIKGRNHVCLLAYLLLCALPHKSLRPLGQFPCFSVWWSTPTTTFGVHSRLRKQQCPELAWTAWKFMFSVAKDKSMLLCTCKQPLFFLAHVNPMVETTRCRLPPPPFTLN
jgi:hypothetical protein